MSSLRVIKALALDAVDGDGPVIHERLLEACGNDRGLYNRALTWAHADGVLEQHYNTVRERSDEVNRLAEELAHWNTKVDP